jgi:autotransporter adhesin
MGQGSTASGNGSTALSQGSTAAGDGSVAIGQGANTTFPNSIVIGNNARGTAPNQVVIGGANDTINFAPLANAPVVQAGRGTRVLTTDAAGNVGVASFDDVFNRLDGVEAFSRRVRQEAREGIAAAMAMTPASMPSAPGRTSWAANGAVFKGEFGAGFSMAHRFNTAVPIAATFGYANGGGGSHGFRAGLMGEF